MGGVNEGSLSGGAAVLTQRSDIGAHPPSRGQDGLGPSLRCDAEFVLHGRAHRPGKRRTGRGDRPALGRHGGWSDVWRVGERGCVNRPPGGGAQAPDKALSCLGLSGERPLRGPLRAVAALWTQAMLFCREGLPSAGPTDWGGGSGYHHLPPQMSRSTVPFLALGVSLGSLRAAQ